MDVCARQSCTGVGLAFTLTVHFGSTAALRDRQKSANSYPSEVVRKSGEIHLTICAIVAPGDGHGREAGMSPLISISSSKAPETPTPSGQIRGFFPLQETCFLSEKGWVTGIAAASPTYWCPGPCPLHHARSLDGHSLISFIGNYIAIIERPS